MFRLNKMFASPTNFFFSRMGTKLKFYYSPCSGCLQHLGKLEAELAKVKSVYAEKSSSFVPHLAAA